MIYQESLKALTAEMEVRRRRDLEAAERQHNEEIAQLKEFYQGKLAEKRDQLEIGQCLYKLGSQYWDFYGIFFLLCNFYLYNCYCELSQIIRNG